MLVIHNLLIKGKKYVEKHIGSLEYININILRYINCLNKQYYLINVTHSNTINFIMKTQLQLKQLLEKLIVIYNDNLYNINLITKKINIINLTTSIYGIKTKYLQDL
jgi:hypothetical protein